MNDEVLIYTVRLWRTHGALRIAVRPVGEDRLHLFTGTEELSTFFVDLAAAAEPVSGAPAGHAAGPSPPAGR